jgi:hypothetical protein
MFIIIVIDTNKLKMKCNLVFTHPDSSAAESSLSARIEGEEGEFYINQLLK